MAEKDDTAMVGGHDLAHATADEVRVFEQELGAGAADDKPNAQDEDSRSVQGTGADDDLHDEDEDTERSAKHDDELAGAKTDTEREAIRQRRRDERQRRKQANRDRTDALLRRQENLEAQNRQMAEQLARLQNNDSASRMAQLDAAIAEAEQVQAQATEAHAAAVARSDGVSATKAMNLMLQARDRHTQLTGVKSQMVQTSRAPSPINPLVRTNAVKFAERNSWYGGPNSTDLDSVVMTQLDNAVTRDGFDPTTPGYWEELETRAKKYLPHRYAGSETQQTTHNASNDTRRTPRSPVGGAGQRNGSSSGSDTGFQLSAERVAAMKEAGIWDNPERRQKMIATYKKLDAEQR